MVADQGRRQVPVPLPVCMTAVPSWVWPPSGARRAGRGSAALGGRAVCAVRARQTPRPPPTEATQRNEEDNPVLQARRLLHTIATQQPFSRTGRELPHAPPVHGAPHESRMHTQPAAGAASAGSAPVGPW